LVRSCRACPYVLSETDLRPLSRDVIGFIVPSRYLHSFPAVAAVSLASGQLVVADGREVAYVLRPSEELVFAGVVYSLGSGT